MNTVFSHYSLHSVSIRIIYGGEKLYDLLYLDVNRSPRSDVDTCCSASLVRCR